MISDFSPTASFSYSFFDAYASDKPTLPIACITPFPIVLADPVWNPGMGELQLTFVPSFDSIPTSLLSPSFISTSDIRDS